MRAFVEGADLAEITHFDRDGAYALISQALERVLYPTLGKADKGVVLRFLEKAGLLPGAYRSPRQAAPPDRPHPGPPQKAPGKALHAPLHARRHRALGRGRRGLRPALRPRHEGDPQARMRALKDYLKRESLRSGFLFPSPHNPANPISQPTCWRRLKRVFESVGLDTNPHSFRKSFVSGLIGGRMDLITVSRFSRHRSIQQLQTYFDRVSLERSFPQFVESLEVPQTV